MVDLAESLVADLVEFIEFIVIKNFSGMTSVVAFSTIFKNSLAKQALGALGVALIGGFAASTVLYYGFHALEANYLLTSVVISTGIAAISMTVLGLKALLGNAGLALGGILMLFVANPLSGIATGPAWLPSPWGTIGQYLPIGAAGTAIRSSTFFDGAAIQQPMTVLLCWVAFGAALLGVGIWRGRGSVGDGKSLVESSQSSESAGS